MRACCRRGRGTGHWQVWLKMIVNQRSSDPEYCEGRQLPNTASSQEGIFLAKREIRYWAYEPHAREKDAKGSGQVIESWIALDG